MWRSVPHPLAQVNPVPLLEQFIQQAADREKTWWTVHCAPPRKCGKGVGRRQEGKGRGMDGGGQKGRKLKSNKEVQ